MTAVPVDSAPINKTKFVDAFQRRRWYWLLVGMAIVYAFLAGLQTVNEFDLFWQLATGRWVAQHHAVFSTDVFSYTAEGQPWLYPVGSGLIFYFTYLVGGYTLLSWLGAATCVGTVALLLRRGSAVTALLAIVAIPAIALRCSPRADIFTVLLFAFFLSVLWKRYETGNGMWWSLPPLMFLWVNLHLGFIAGLGLALAYAGTEAIRLITTHGEKWNSRPMQFLLIWLCAIFTATLVNPWGWGIYTAISRQNEAMAAHSTHILEWASIPLNHAALLQFFALRDPSSATMWILLAAVIIAILALLRQQWFAVLLLVGSLWVAIEHMRFLALLACIVVVVGGSVLTSSWKPLRAHLPFTQLHTPIATGAAITIILLATLRSVDLVSYRNAMRGDAISSFGTGLSWWFPDRALDFIAREHLPPQIFHGYEDGAFVAWKLGPEYKDYVDSRAIPFGPDLFPNLEGLMAAPADSNTWQSTADAYGIHTVVFSLARYDGLVHVFDSLHSYCNSSTWRPVYMDELSVVFVQRTPETESLIARYPLDCSTVQLPAESHSTSTIDEFNRWANAAVLLEYLGRPNESLDASNKALAIYPDAPWVLYFRARAELEIADSQDAERDLLRSAALDNRPSTWSLLSALYKSQGKFSEAAHALQHAEAASNGANH